MHISRTMSVKIISIYTFNYANTCTLDSYNKVLNWKLSIAKYWLKLVDSWVLIYQENYGELFDGSLVFLLSHTHLDHLLWEHNALKQQCSVGTLPYIKISVLLVRILQIILPK